MSNRPKDDELREVWARLQQEFDQRPPASDDGATRPPNYPQTGETTRLPPPDAQRPIYGEATPIPTPRRVRVPLPASKPRIVYALIALNVIMFVATLVVERGRTSILREPFSGEGFGPFEAALYILGAKWGPAIDAGQWWRLITPMILHGSLVHLGFNSYALYALGPESERVYGLWRFLAIYLIAGIAGNVASYMITPDQLAIGASGAIFGLIGALAAFAYASRGILGKERAEAQIKQLIGMAAINLVLGFVIPNIDNSAHIGGMIAGGLAGLALAPRYAVDRRVFPPALVTTGRSAQGWLGALALLVGILGIAAYRIVSR